MSDDFLDQLVKERDALLDLMRSRPTEDWTLERERVAELGMLTREHKERMRPEAQTRRWSRTTWR
jgi:hypothetical protein